MTTSSHFWKTIGTLVLLTGVLGTWYLFDVDGYLNLESILANASLIRQFIDTNRTCSIVLFFLLYTVFAAACLPGLSILTFGAGLFFEFALGTLICSFASTIGASIAFLAARHIIGASIESRFGQVLHKTNRELTRNGIFYVLSIRLIPVFPFQVINVVLGVSKISFPTFYIYSQIGMLPATAILANAGSQSSEIRTINDIFTPPIFWALILLACIPVLARLYKAVRKNY